MALVGRRQSIYVQSKLSPEDDKQLTEDLYNYVQETRILEFFLRSDLSMELRITMVRCYKYSVPFYDCESLTLDSSIQRNELFTCICSDY